VICSFVPAQLHEGLDEASITLCVDFLKRRRDNVGVNHVVGTLEKHSGQAVLVLGRLANAGGNGGSVHGKWGRSGSGCGDAVGKRRRTRVNQVDDVGRSFQDEQLLVLSDGLRRYTFPIDTRVLLRDVSKQSALRRGDNGADGLEMIGDGHHGVALLAQIQIHIDVLSAQNLHTQRSCRSVQHAAHVALCHVVDVAKLVRLLKVCVEVGRRGVSSTPVLNAFHLALHVLAQILACALRAAHGNQPVSRRFVEVVRNLSATTSVSEEYADRFKPSLPKSIYDEYAKARFARLLKQTYLGKALVIKLKTLARFDLTCLYTPIRPPYCPSSTSVMTRS
jgi:hypothetical protein